MNGRLVTDLAAQVARDGFVVLHGLCATEFLEQVMEVGDRRIREVQDVLGDREIGIGSAAGYEEVVQRSPGRWDFPITPQQFGFETMALPWSPLIRTVLGADAEHSFSGVVFSDPGSPAQFWHIDSPHVSAGHLPAHALNVLVALHDISVAMGPTELARGSHVLTNHLANPSLLSDELVYQHAGTTPELLVSGMPAQVPERVASRLPAGSCLVFDDRILHRGLANRSGAIRYVAYFSYRRSGYSGNTHFESQRSVFDVAV